MVFVAWFDYCIAYDTVIFSTLKLKKMAVEDLVASSKVLAIGIKDFSLPNFGVYAQAYSVENSDGPFASIMPIFPYRKALPMENPLLMASNNADRSAQKTDENKKQMEKKTDVNYITFDTFEDLRDILSTTENFKDYQTVIISSRDAFEEELIRRKRVSSDPIFDEEPSDEASETRGQKQAGSRQRLAAADRYDMPVVLPPVPSQKTACLLYMEAFDIIIPNSHFLTVNSEGKNKYSADPDHCKCNVSNSQGGASFIIDVEVGEDIEDAKKEFSLKNGTTITFQLDFVRSQNGYWYLNGTTLKNNFKITAIGGKEDLTVNNDTAMNRVDVGAVFNQNFACYQTDAAMFNVSGDKNPARIGISLRNFEVSLRLTGDETKFGYYTSDCIGTFSAGTWMGIIISVVFISILLFGYLMVQSIQTMDRFDDLKQKPIVINFKE
uniref:V-type proton ATPase subunit S1/VOA1 transmembrane domain-containing protein n=1 Tax=Onchocerca volvulus TaxID=6282 RepID=A0A2K6W3F0_ONCVO